ncbi:TIGR02206 family membrane protein [Halobacillus halophilus]|uniref:YwaF family protein n=1 Tax=Halobacillus halophilus TaxID=1570 RepID=UPI001CD6B92A|nr:TIGR02206 family membrane protein [Halobacillus halophilus]MCA1010954.1 TIGR02206 family membrane protein [Halobacillus halophilus]
MKNWFGTGSRYPFEIMGVSHITMLFIFTLVLFSIALASNWLHTHERFRQIMRYSLLVLLLLSEISYQLWAYVNGVWSLGGHVPLHLCGVASLIGIYTLITYQPTLIKINFFIGILPALIALITPDVPFDFHHYRFWKFFLHHMAIPWASLFLVVTSSVRITWKDMTNSYLLLVGYALIIGFLNPLMGANYLYLEHPPTVFTPLSLMGEGMIYYLNLAATAFLAFAFMYGFYKLGSRIKLL